MLFYQSPCYFQSTMLFLGSRYIAITDKFDTRVLPTEKAPVIRQQRHRITRTRQKRHDQSHAVPLKKILFHPLRRFSSAGSNHMKRSTVFYCDKRPNICTSAFYTASITTPWQIPGTVRPSLKLVFDRRAPVGRKRTLFQFPASSCFRT